MNQIQPATDDEIDEILAGLTVREAAAVPLDTCEWSGFVVAMLIRRIEIERERAADFGEALATVEMMAMNHKGASMSQTLIDIAATAGAAWGNR